MYSITRRDDESFAEDEITPTSSRSCLADENCLSVEFSSNQNENNQTLNTSRLTTSVNAATQTDNCTTGCCINTIFTNSVINTLAIGSCCGNSTNPAQNEFWPQLKKLKVLLSERVKKVCSLFAENYLFNGRSIKVAPVEISREVYHETVYQSTVKKSRTKQAASRDRVAIGDFFKEATKLVHEQTKNWDDTKVKKDNKIFYNCNVIGIIGPAGIGKTTLTKYIAQKTIEKELYNDVTFLFYIQFRDIDFDVEHPNLLKFLLSSSYINWDDDPVIDKEILNALDKDSQVMIILDGLNEGSFSQLSKFPPAVTLSSKAKAETFIKGLLGGKLLPNSKKILTSRPRQIYELHYDCRPLLILNHLGFAESSQKAVCHALCGESHETVFECITNNSRIASICSNPLYCILVVQCIEKQLQQNDVTDVMGSVTEIFAAVLEMFICSDYLPGDFKCGTLPELAWNGMVSNQYNFSESDLEKTGVNRKILNTFFGHHVVPSLGRKITSPQQKSFFDHPLFMEFLAALKLVQTTDDKIFCENLTFLSFLSSSRFETVTKFLFGLFNPNTVPRISRIGISNQVSNNDTRIRMAKDFALVALRSACAENTRTSVRVVWSVCSCAYEMQDESFAVEIAESLGNKLSVVNNIFPEEIAGFCYVLQALKSDDFDLSLDPCTKFIGNSFCQFFEKMLGIANHKNIKMPVVDVSRNKIGDEEIKALARCLPQITTLSLIDCQIRTSQVKIITEKIFELESPLFEIYFAYNPLDNLAAECIARCIHKIEKLHLSLCYFSENAISVLAEAIVARPSPLKHFCYSGNMTNEKMFLLASCIDKTDEFVIGLRNEQKNVVQGFDRICDAIHSRIHPLNFVSIRGTNFGNEGFVSLSKCIHNIKNLRLGCTYDANLTSFGIEVLAAAFSKLDTPMESLFFDCPDQYIEEAKVELSYCLANIKKLNIQ